MTNQTRSLLRAPILVLLLLQILAINSRAQNSIIKVNVDATEAARNLLRTTLAIPVKPGPLSLFYPKWIPGYRKVDGKRIITHQHSSVPFDVESGKASLDLKP